MPNGRFDAGGAWRWILILLFGLCLLCAMVWPQVLLSHVQGLLRATRDLGALSWVVFAAAQVLIAVSGILPASLICILAGAAYGLPVGFVLSTLGTLTGAGLAFALSRSVFRMRVERLLANQPRLRNFDQLIAEDGWKFVCLVRISPVMPFSAASLALGLSSISARSYFLGTLAALPALFGYVFIGTMADTALLAWQTGAEPIRWGIALVGAAASILLLMQLGHIARKVARAPPAGTVADTVATLKVLPKHTRTNTWPPFLVLLCWSGVVAFGIAHHEYWRDEVRALSLALSASHIWTLPLAVHGDGHPILWYLLLRVAHDIVGTPSVMPLVSFAVAACGVAIFMLRSPFPLWWKVLFVFGGLALYEYVVMARNYGISMLLMFAFAATACGPKRPPLLLGGILFLLAQTNVHSALLVLPLLAVWFDQMAFERQATTHVERRLGPFWIGAAMAATGILCAVLTVYPSRHSLLDVEAVGKLAYAKGSLLKGLGLAVLEPGYFYRKLTLLPKLPGTLLLYGATLGLARRPVLLAAALLGLWANSTLFALVYGSGYRHQGIWLIFLISLYWIALEQSGPGKPVPLWQAWTWNFSVWLVLPVLLLINCVGGYRLLETDVRFEVSKGKALVAALHSDPTLRDASVLAEPDELVESIPYYASNPTFLAHEHAAGNTATWSRAFKSRTSLGDLLEYARQLGARSGRPIVIIIGHELRDDAVDKPFLEDYGRSFVYSSDELREFRSATTRLAIGPAASTVMHNDNFDAYLLR